MKNCQPKALLDLARPSTLLLVSLLLGAASGGILTSCRNTESSEEGSSIQTAKTLPNNGPFEIHFSEETCLKLGTSLPEETCSRDPKNSQCWVGKGSILTIRNLFQASNIGSNSEKYLFFQVTDVLTNTLSTDSSEKSDSSDANPETCETAALNASMQRGSKSAFIWSGHIKSIKDSAGKTVSPKQVPIAPSGKASSIFDLVARGVFTSRFGWRWGRLHAGIDIAYDIGTPIFAYCSGLVTIASNAYPGYGTLIEIEHDASQCNGVGTTRYGHSERLFVRKGEYVSGLQKIAEIGSRGRSTGPHLHFETYPPGDSGAVDPLKFLTEDHGRRLSPLEWFKNLRIHIEHDLKVEFPDALGISSSAGPEETLSFLRDTMGFSTAPIIGKIPVVQSELPYALGLVGPTANSALEFSENQPAFGNRAAIFSFTVKDRLSIEIDMHGNQLPIRN